MKEINEMDITALQQRMAKADWYYEYSEDSAVWNRGVREINEIKKQLEELCRQGRYQTANNLWNIYVPEYSISKPDFLTLNDKVMNEKNLEYLQNDLKYLGFGDALKEELQKNMQEKKAEFNLQMLVDYNGRSMQTDLSFKAGKDNDMYFFNNYRATMKDNPELSQLFYVDKGKGITTKEAFNLLEGRAVNKDLINKDGEQYNAWLQINFKEKEANGNYKTQRYHENYNYDLGKAMSELVLKPMSPENIEKLYNSLLKGNVQATTFLKDGEEVKAFIEANPRERTINIYDEKMNRLSEDKKQDLMDLPQVKQQKQNVSAGSEEGSGPELKKKRTRKQGNGQSV